MKWRGAESVGAPLLERDEVVLRGQDVRTRTAYSAPLTVEVEAQLEKREGDAGFFACMFVPTGQSTNAEPKESMAVMLQYSHAGDSVVGMLRSAKLQHDETIFSQRFAHPAGQPYRLSIGVTKAGLHIKLGGQLYEVPGAKVPYNKFHIVISAAPPADRWHVRDFVVR